MSEISDSTNSVWPTDESFAAANAVCRERGLIPFAHSKDWREFFRAAMLADPIIRAAIACRYARSDEAVDAASRSLDAAVDEAGL